MSLSGLTAVVVGGTSGIGRSLALGLARAGADVIASSRSREAVESIADEIAATGVRTLRVPSDVGSRESLVALRESVLAEFGSVDILINSAGMTKRIPTLELDEDTWNHILDVNLTGTLRGCQIFGEQMVKRGFGRIINVASLASFVAFQEVTAYGASKAGVASLTRSLAVEWSRFGVTGMRLHQASFPRR